GPGREERKAAFGGGLPGYKLHRLTGWAEHPQLRADEGWFVRSGSGSEDCDSPLCPPEHKRSRLLRPHQPILSVRDVHDMDRSTSWHLRVLRMDVGLPI